MITKNSYVDYRKIQSVAWAVEASAVSFKLSQKTHLKVGQEPLNFKGKQQFQ